jgi:ABC-type uncharacterized transport system involved in gliding motility auxiliary subunit
VRSLKSPLEVDAYVMRGLPRLDHFTSELRDLLAAYEQQGAGKLKFRLIDVNSQALRDQAKLEGLRELPLGDPDETDATRIRTSRGYLGLVFRYGGEKAVIPTLHPDAIDGLEFWVSNKIREIRDKADGIKHRIGIVSGKNELKLSDTNLVAQGGSTAAPSIKGIIEQAFPYYRIEEVDLARGATAIDPLLSGLIITQPQDDYVEPELRRIDEFLMRGEKSLVVFASAVNVKPGDSKLQAHLSTRGLDALLDGYGIHLNKDAVFDHGAQFRVQVRTPKGEPQWLRHPGVVWVTNDPAVSAEQWRLDSGFIPFFQMDEVMFPFASSLELMRDKQPPDVALAEVARSTPATSVETSGPVDMSLRDQWTHKPPVAQRALAAYAMGKLRSAFAGKPHGSVGTLERAPRTSRVLVISSSQFLTNPFAYAGNAAGRGAADPQLQSLAQPYAKNLTSTILVLKNSLDWMLGDEDLVAVSAKLSGRKR